MNTLERISSILGAATLDASISGFPSFSLENLEVLATNDFQFPNNLRLGHLAEKAFALALNTSSNYRIVSENIQIIDGGKTLGEIDFIVEDKESNSLIHIELSYKFYLYDSSDREWQMRHFIGPNRKDSMVEKLEKLSNKQFPLLHHPSARSALNNLDTQAVVQKLCFMFAVYIPHNVQPIFHPVFSPGIRGVYMSFEVFLSHHSDGNRYHLPHKKEWGMCPSKNQLWQTLSAVKEQINLGMKEKQSVLCWQNCSGVFSEIFIVWW